MSIDVVFKCLEIIFDRKAVIRKGVPQASSAMQCNNTLKVGKPSVEKKKNYITNSPNNLWTKDNI